MSNIAGNIIKGRHFTVSRNQQFGFGKQLKKKCRAKDEV
jgi:hypothetical protein